MHPHLVWFAKDLIAPAVAGRAVSEFRRSWSARLATRVRKETKEFRVRRRRLKRWLLKPETWDALCRAHQREHLEELVRGAKAEVFTKRQRAQEGAREDAESVVGLLLAAFLNELDSSNAVSVAHFRQMRELRIIRTHLEDEDDFEDNVSNLPPAVRPLLARGRASSGQHASRLAAILAAASNPVETARGIDVDPPECLVHGPEVLWAAVAEFARAHDQVEPAARAFEKAARHGAEPRAWLYLRAAFAAAAADDKAQANRLFSRAKALGTLGELAEAFVKAALAWDEAVLRSFRQRINEVEDIIRHEMTVMIALAMAPEDLHSAVALAESALSDNPESAGVHIILAGWLHQLGNRAIPEASRYRREALRHAEAARDLRRQWRGPSQEAVAVLLRIHLAQGSFQEVIKHGVEPPLGTALASEADDPEVRELVTVALVALDKLDEARAWVDELRDGSARLLVEGIIADAAGDTDLASERYEGALEAAETPADRLQVQVSLAMNGKWPIPGWDETLVDEPEMARRMEVMSLSARGDTDGAGKVLRQDLADSRVHAQLHASILEKGGRTTDAVSVLESAATRFDDPHMLVSAAELCMDQLEIAEPPLRRAITRLDLAASRRARLVLTQLLFDAGRHGEAEALLRPLYEADPTDSDVRWGLIAVLASIGRLDSAWAVYSRNPRPKPASDWQAKLWVDLHLRYEMTRQTIETGLKLARIFGDSESFVSSLALAILLSDDSLLEEAEELRTAFQRLLGDFFERFPDSQALRQEEATPERLVEIARQRSQTDEAIKSAIAMVRDGELPIGILGSVSGRPVTSAILMRPAGFWFIQRRNASAIAAEDAVARAAIGSQVALDVTTLALVASVPALGDLITRHTVRRFVSHSTLRDIQGGVGELRAPVHATWGWDAEQSRVVVTYVDANARQSLAERADAMAEFSSAGELHTGTRGWAREELPEDYDGWLGGIDVACALGIPLLCDDVVLRDFARGHGIEVFGSVALIGALRDGGLLEPAKFDDLMASLVREYCVDLPLTLTAIEKAAAVDAWQPAGAAFALSRNATWQELGDETLRFYRRAISAAVHLGDEHVAAWMTSAIRALPSVSPEARVTLLTTLFLQAAHAAGSVRTMAPVLLPAFRTAADEVLWLADPLPAAAKRLYELAVDQLPTGAAVQYVLRELSGLDEDDRAVVLRALVGR